MVVPLNIFVEIIYFYGLFDLFPWMFKRTTFSWNFKIYLFIYFPHFAQHIHICIITVFISPGLASQTWASVRSTRKFCKTLEGTLRWSLEFSPSKRQTPPLLQTSLRSQGRSSGLGSCTAASRSPWISSSRCLGYSAPKMPNQSFEITTGWPRCCWSLRCFIIRAGWHRSVVL